MQQRHLTADNVMSEFREAEGDLKQANREYLTEVPRETERRECEFTDLQPKPQGSQQRIHAAVFNSPTTHDLQSISLLMV